MNTALQTITLGHTDITVPAIGVGAWQWGDRFFWGQATRDEWAAAYTASLDAGLTLVDTAEIYGPHTSERLIAEYKRADGRPVVIATKYSPIPFWRLGHTSFMRALRGSLKRLEVESADLYQIHAHIGMRSVEALMDSMAEAVKQGLVRAVGVSNYGLDAMRRAADALDKHGIPLTSNQVPYHLLNFHYVDNGVLAACQEMGVTLIAYSPLAQGLLTGKYHQADAAPTGVRRRAAAFRPENIARTRPLLNVMQQIAATHNKTPAQVALNWLLHQPNVLPIPGAKNARQASANAGALGWRLTDDQADQLTQLARSVVVN